MTDIRPLRNEADYDAALAAIEAHFENEPTLGSPEADHFAFLAVVISDYETKHWAIARDIAQMVSQVVERIARPLNRICHVQ